MAVVFGNADVYLHSGRQYERDSAAPVAVARELACTPRASMARPSFTTNPTPGCPTPLKSERDRSSAPWPLTTATQPVGLVVTLVLGDLFGRIGA